MTGPEIIIDSFAGGGGASQGILQALGRDPDVAINHDAQAVAMHRANHPGSVHFCQSVWRADPRDVAGSRPVGLLWASPDCKHFSKAKGAKPVEKRIRDLAWVVVHYAKLVAPRIIILENVEEFAGWGPLGPDNLPCPERKGETFRRWLRELRRLGYAVEWRELRACDYGAPTIRKRLFLIARRDGRKIVWPPPTHGPDRPLPWRTAADIIDWSIPCPSIFERARPLADATCRRIARGVMRYVIETATPFIVPITHAGSDRVHSIDQPLRTITTAHRGELALVAAFLAQHNGGVIGREAGEPLSTITTRGTQQGLVATHLVKLRGSCRDGQPTDRPLPTITAGGQHLAEVRAFLIKYYGADQDPRLAEPLHTVTTRDRFGLVTVAIDDERWALADIGMRMLSPRELFRAQGFPEDYRIDPPFEGRPLGRTAQIRMCGNSVCPPLAEALVRANASDLAAARERRAA